MNNNQRYLFLILIFKIAINFNATAECYTTKTKAKKVDCRPMVRRVQLHTPLSKVLFKGNDKENKCALLTQRLNKLNQHGKKNAMVESWPKQKKIIRTAIVVDQIHPDSIYWNNHG